jgi:hypothetical protein
MSDRHPLDRLGDLLALARRDRMAASKALAQLPVEAQLALVCDAPVARRREILDLLPAPERVVPLLPEAELVFTVKAIGLDEAAWLLEIATPDQVTACLDLDAWRGTALDRPALDAWMAALAEIGDEALIRHLHAIDPELSVLYLQDHAEVVLKPAASEEAAFEPPPGAQSLDGQFYLVARRESDDLAPLLRILRALFQSDYWAYFRLLQGAIWELPTESEEWAARWRSGRLEDLGFPPWDEAMGIYRYVRAGERARLPEEPVALDVEEWRLPVWVPSLPAGRDARHLVFRAIGELGEAERRAAFHQLVALANKVAVADRLELADAASIPSAIEKAALWVSRGLAHVAAANEVGAAEALRRLPMERLFRIAASLDPKSARPRARSADDDGPTTRARREIPTGPRARAPNASRGRPPGASCACCRRRALRRSRSSCGRPRRGRRRTRRPRCTSSPPPWCATWR